MQNISKADKMKYLDIFFFSWIILVVLIYISEFEHYINQVVNTLYNLF